MNDDGKIVMNWSSGKDAALAYYTLLQNKSNVSHLLTTLSEEHDRIFMHGIREQLLDEQAKRIGLPQIKVKLPASPDDSIYKQAMLDIMEKLKNEGVSAAAYGDIFLEDLRAYREQQLQQAGMKAIFPLWNRDSAELIEAIEHAGIEAIIVCVNEKQMGKEYLGQKISWELVNSFPAGVDLCGENGEFHTFVYDAPFFKSSIPITTGEIVHKSYKSPDGNTAWDTGFYFLDVNLSA